MRPMWNRGATLFAIILATLAAQIMIERITILTLGDQPRSLRRVHQRRPAEARRLAVELSALLDPRLRRPDGAAAVAVLHPDPHRARAARLLAEPRSRGAARHSGVAHAAGLVRAQRRARRRRRHPGDADAIHGLQRRRRRSASTASSRRSSAASAAPPARSPAACCSALLQAVAIVRLRRRLQERRGAVDPAGRAAVVPERDFRWPEEPDEGETDGCKDA